MLTFRDPSILPPDVESVIKINSRQTAASFPGLPKFSLLGEGQRAQVSSGTSDQQHYTKFSDRESSGTALPQALWATSGLLGCGTRALPEMSADCCWALRHTLGKPACCATAQGRVRRAESGGPSWRGAVGTEALREDVHLCSRREGRHGPRTKQPYLGSSPDLAT